MLDSAAMRAATIRDREILVEQHPDPRPGKDEVLVRVRAAGLNGADMMQTRGLYPAPPGWPQDIPGLELAGEVVENGPGATRFDEGDRVMAIVGGGGQAELAVVHERMLMPVPDRARLARRRVASRRSSRPRTTRSSRRSACRPASGCSCTAAPAASAPRRSSSASTAGARVTATVRNPGNREHVAALGASVIEPDGFEQHGPFDAILELVGAPNLGANVDALATSGRIVVIGIAAGAKGELNLAKLMYKRGRVMASTMRARPLEQKALMTRGLERHVLPLVERGAIRVPVAETFPLDDAPAAYERFAAGGKLGKLVLLP